MKNTYIFIMLLFGFLSNSTNAQNLVPNPSFEQYDTCPDYSNQVYRCLGWENWLTTPDYFNVCAPCCAVSVPYNLGLNYPNFQMPHSGDAYMGYFNYWSREYIYIWPWIRELIGCQLSQPLQIGVTYNFEMHVSLAQWCISYAPCGTNKIGVKFTNQSFAGYGNQNLSPLVDNTATIYFDTLITDTTNWVLLTGTFLADSAYTHMAIGNFFDDFHTDSMIIGSDSLCFSYYFIDDVSLTSAAGINSEWNSGQLEIYPNPFNNLTKIKLRDMTINTEIKICNFLGDNVTNKFGIKKTAEGFLIDRNQVASSIYLVSIFQNDKFYSQKLIIN